jgi:hypothetical protein
VTEDGVTEDGVTEDGLTETVMIHVAGRTFCSTPRSGVGRVSLLWWGRGVCGSLCRVFGVQDLLLRFDKACGSCSAHAGIFMRGRIKFCKAEIRSDLIWRKNSVACEKKKRRKRRLVSP